MSISVEVLLLADSKFASAVKAASVDYAKTVGEHGSGHGLGHAHAWAFKALVEAALVGKALTISSKDALVSALNAQVPPFVDESLVTKCIVRPAKEVNHVRLLLAMPKSLLPAWQILREALVKGDAKLLRDCEGGGASPSARAEEAMQLSLQKSTIRAFYEEHAPHQLSRQQEIFAKYAGREGHLLNALGRRYEPERVAPDAPEASSSSSTRARSRSRRPAILRPRINEMPGGRRS